MSKKRILVSITEGKCKTTHLEGLIKKSWWRSMVLPALVALVMALSSDEI